MNKVDAVFYDLDNTLYRQLEDVRQRIAYCARKFRLPDAVEILSFWLKEWSERGPAERNYIDKVIERFSLKVDREAMIEEYRSCTTTLSLDEKVYDFLAMVRERGIKQFLITNGHLQTQMRKIESLGVRELFTEVVVASGLYAKPSCYWFTTMLELHGLNPSQCISIGDWFAVDGAASAGAGIRYIHLTGGPVREPLPDTVVCINNIFNLGGFL